MKLSDYRGEEALDVLADIIEPLSLILADKEIRDLAGKKGTPALTYVKPIIKNHKKEIIQILARLEGESVEEYEPKITLLTLPMQVVDLINDPEVQSLFHSQEQNQVTSSASSTPVTEITEAKGK
jgi:hypothetical protein